MARPFKTPFLCAVALAALAGCANTPTPDIPLVESRSNKIAKSLDTVATARSTEDMDPISRAAYWGTRYDRNPSDPETAATYSKTLREMGNNDEALKVMSRFVNNVGQPGMVSLEYGKVLIANDRAFEAVRPLSQAVEGSEKDNWQAWSAYGVAMDKIGEHDSARDYYDRALALAPGKASVLNNKGLSYALSGKLSLAELTLRQAAGSMDGTATVRQNLALVLGFAGRAQEAERLARADLPPRVADNNIAYFRSLVSQPAYWQEFTGDNVELPDFGETEIDPPRAAHMTPVEETTLAPVPVRTLPADSAPANAAPTQLGAQPAPQAVAPAEEPEQQADEAGENVMSAAQGDAVQG